MKKIIIITFVIFLSYQLFVIDISYPQITKPDSTNSILEFSLRSLQQSADNVKSQNAILFADNDSLRNKIQNLQKELGNLKIYKEKAILGTYPAGENMATQDKENYILNGKEIRINKNIEFFDKSRVKEKRSLFIKNTNTDNIKNEIQNIEEDILKLKSEINLLSANSVRNEFKIRKRELLSECKSSKNQLRITQHTLNKLKKRYSHPFRKMDLLKDRHNQLKQDFLILKDKIEMALDKQKNLKVEVADVSKNNDKKFSNLGSSISELRAKKKELQGIVFKTKEKLEVNNIKFAKEKDVKKKLKQNLDTIKGENKKLNKEVLSLQKQVKELKK